MRFFQRRGYYEKTNCRIIGPRPYFRSCLCSGWTGGQSAKWTVGVCQLVQHPALDAATQGFKDALVKDLGDDVKIDEQNASGEPANCSTIINGFVAKNVDLILANATAPLQAAASATSTIPVLGTSVGQEQ